MPLCQEMVPDTFIPLLTPLFLFIPDTFILTPLFSFDVMIMAFINFALIVEGLR